MAGQKDIVQGKVLEAPSLSDNLYVVKDYQGRIFLQWYSHR